jgi:hypothetical protein
MLVYKKQLLYVYTPVYESGGELFPVVCQRTLYGLVCGQLTFIGYTLIRGCRFEVRGTRIDNVKPWLVLF